MSLAPKRTGPRANVYQWSNSSRLWTGRTTVKKWRRRSAAVKFRVALEGSKTIRQLSSEHDVPANLIQAWKRALEAAAFAGAGRGRAAGIGVPSNSRPAWPTSAGTTSQNSATEHSEFHLAQPAPECVSGQNSRGFYSVRSEGALGRRTRPAVHRRDLRSLKKCPSKKFEFPPTQESISSKPSRSNQFPRRGKTTTHRGFTGPTRSQGDDMDTHTNASQTHKWPQPTAIHPV